jgi:adenylate cyclase
MLAVAVYRSQGMLGRAVQAERSRANLARYFSPTMVDELAGNDRPFEGARKQEIGVLFADIVGFTHLAEKATPGEVIELLREFHGRVADVIFRHGGTLDKFIGDCVMATFGTPLPAPGDATRTIFCATRIGESIAAWNAERIATGLEPIGVGIGAHYGSVVLGDIGDDRRLEFAVLGDTVNVASRLEGLTRGLSRTILISDDLVQAARKEGYTVGALLLRFAQLPSQQLRNRDQLVSVWGSAMSARGSDLTAAGAPRSA